MFAGSDGDFEDQNCFFDPDGFVCETMLAKVIQHRSCIELMLLEVHD